MTDSPIPLVTGAAGLTGRPLLVREDTLTEYDAEGEPVYTEPLAPGRALPAPCLRVLSGVPRSECRTECPGRQQDGSCLCDVVRTANEHDVEWSFEIDSHGYWVYNGPPIN